MSHSDHSSHPHSRPKAWSKNIDKTQLIAFIKNPHEWLSCNVEVDGERCILHESFGIVFENLPNKKRVRQREDILLQGVHKSNFISVQFDYEVFRKSGLPTRSWKQHDIQIYQSNPRRKPPAFAHMHLGNADPAEVVERMIAAATAPSAYLAEKGDLRKYRQFEMMHGTAITPPRKFIKRTAAGDSTTSLLIIGEKLGRPPASTTCENELGTGSGQTITVDTIVFKLYY